MGAISACGVAVCCSSSSSWQGSHILAQRQALLRQACYLLTAVLAADARTAAGALFPAWVV